MGDKKYLEIVLRYFVLLIVVLVGFKIFYFLFLPATKYLTYYFLQIFYSVEMHYNYLFLEGKTIEIVGACIAGSAYSLLLILNLLTPMKFIIRLKIIVISFFAFFILNLIRILVLAFMYVEETFGFDFVHKALWYLGSTVLVILIWFLTVKLNEVKTIPFVSDFKELLAEVSKKKIKKINQNKTSKKKVKRKIKKKKINRNKLSRGQRLSFDMRNLLKD